VASGIRLRYRNDLSRNFSHKSTPINLPGSLQSHFSRKLACSVLELSAFSASNVSRFEMRNFAKGMPADIPHAELDLVNDSA